MTPSNTTIIALSISSLYFDDFPDWIKEGRRKQSYYTASTGTYLESSANHLSNLESFWLADVIELLAAYPCSSKNLDTGIIQLRWYDNKSKESILAMTRSSNPDIVIASQRFISKHLRIFPNANIHAI
jgi:hypothetical protein